MAGIEAGKTWSRIGAEVAPTSSAASGVWGDLNEIAENIGAGTWPAPQFTFEKIATITPGTGTATLTFSGIPSGYKHLEVIFFSSTAASTYQGDAALVTNNIGGTAAYNYVYQSMSGVNASTIDETNAGNVTAAKGPYLGDDTHGAVGRMLFTNYLGPGGTTSGGGQPMIFEGAAFHTNTANKYARPIFGQSEEELSSAGAITSITIDHASSGNYTAEATFVLYGLRGA
tara:strand:- start:3241 stop:3927 length:687 start_codon:yes stop_codon:yes gene_type:complete